MKKVFILTILTGFILLPRLLFAQTVFSDNFDRSSFTSGSTGGTPATTYNFVLGSGTIATGLVSGSDYEVTITSGAGAGANAKNYIWAPLTGYATPFNATLSSNSPAVITWTFNMRTSVAATGVPTQAAMGGGVALVCNGGSNIYNGTGVSAGYGVIFNSSGTGGVSLVRFTDGMNGSTVLITETTTMSKTDYYSVRVTFDASANNWSLYVRDDGASAFADPSSGVTTQQGSTINDATYVSTAMTDFGVVYTNTSGAGKVMDFDNFTVTEVLPPCAGTPVAGTASATVASGCGLNYASTLSLAGGQQAMGLSYQWASSTDDATWTSVTGATNNTYAATVAGNVYYTCSVTCANSGVTATAVSTFMGIDIPKFANVPFSESFESTWQNGCGTADQPDSFWINTYATGNRSLRRSDDFTTAGWTYGSDGIYSPPASDGSYSADFSTYSVSSGNWGALNLYINFPVGTKQISYDYINEDGTDNIECDISTDGGVTFIQYDLPPDNATSWTTRTFTTTITASPAIVRFKCTSDFGVSNIGLDNVRICMATAPVSGSTVLCAGTSNTLSDTSDADMGTWSSSSTSIATVNSSGIYTGVSGGVDTIYYTSALNCAASILVTVNPTPAAIAPMVVCTGQMQVLNEGVPYGTFSVNNPAVATVDPVLGTVTGISQGTAIVSYVLPTTCNVADTVIVNLSPAPISGSANICFGQSTDYGSTTIGGVWSSSNLTSVTIGSGTGVATGVALGTTLISYMIPTTGCVLSLVATVNPTPSALVGNTPLCAGSSQYLSDSTYGGVGMYYSSNLAAATVDPLAGIVTGVAAGTSVISYMLPWGCFVSDTAQVLLTPTLVSESAGTNLCSGIPFSSVFNAAPTGGTWSSSNTYQAVVDPVSGVVTGISAGNPNISYTLANGCSLVQPATIINGPAPITGLSAICRGTTTTLADATAGGTWSTTGGFFTIGASAGFVTGLSAGNSMVTYSISNGCFATVSFTVNALPIAQTMAGGGEYCAGSGGKDISIGATTEAGVTYSLYNGSSFVGSLPGNGGTVDFGLITPAGAYSVMATSAAGCNTNIVTSVNITVDPLPVDSFALLGGGGYCPGAAGVDLYLDNSETLTSYSLWSEGTLVNTVISFGGGLVDFNPTYTAGPFEYLAGDYTVIAENLTSGCQSTLAAGSSVYLYTAPDAYNVTGSGSYCPYTAGLHVGLDYSTLGIEYDLFNGGTMPVMSLSGAASSLDFGLMATGSYSVTATNTLSGCTSQMNGVANIAPYGLPTSYPIGGGGSYCAGGTGVDVSIYPSDPGTYYQLYNLNTPVGMALEGNTGLLDFGNQTLDSSYTIVATNGGSGCYNQMSGVDTVYVLPAPAGFGLTGGGAYCAGGAGVPVGLSGSQNGVSYMAMSGSTPLTTGVDGTGGSIGLGTVSTAGNYTVLATNIGTGCTAVMPGTGLVTIDALPVAYDVLGGGAYCSGTTGVHVGLDHSATGVNYTLFMDGIAVDTEAGNNVALDFGLQTASGTYTVQAVNVTTRCGSAMANTVPVSINPSPATYLLSSTSSSYCIGGSGVTLNLNGTDAGLIYQLYLNGSPVGGTVTGMGAPVSFGLQTGVGTYTVGADNTATGCTAQMSAAPVISLSPLPEQFNVTGGGSYCAGATGVVIGLNSTTNHCLYNLYNSTGTLVATATGTGGVLNFAPQTGAGWYKAIAIDPTTTCANNMNDSALVGVNALPAIDTVTGGGGYCAGTAGVHMGMNTSSSGISYNLYNGATLASTVAGSTGSSLDFGTMSAAGMYSVIAVNMATGCQAAMFGTTSATENPLPPVYTMYGGGGYCAGTTGVHVNLSGSTAGVNYQLYYDGVATGSTVPATGSALDFGLKTAPGNYTALAIDPATGCSSNMIGLSNVVINALPAAYNVTGGGDYCAGGTGSYVGINSSDIGYMYKLYVDGGSLASSLPGSGLPLSFGLQTLAGSYSVVSTNNSTGCSSNMTGTATIHVDAIVAPGVSLSSGTDVQTCAGQVLTITASPVNGGTAPGFMWTVNTIAAGSGNTLTYVPTNGDRIGLTMTSNAACAWPLTANAATLVTVDAYVTPAATISAVPGTTVCSGTAITATAATVNTGTAPVYTWLVNNVPVGTGVSYTYVPTNNDVLEFVLQSNIQCSSADEVFSNTLLMESDVPYLPIVTLTAVPGTNITAGMPVTLHADATNAGPSPTYQWLRNGVAMAGANGQTITMSDLQNGDSITCVVTSNSNACGSNTGENSLKMIIGDLGVSQIQGGANLMVSPNPSNGNFTLKGSVKDAGNRLSITVTDVLGQVVYHGTTACANGVVDDEIMMGNEVANGLYLLTVKMATGEATYHISIQR